jgi:quinol monooxygenase YgiN/quercetin dioxygenase-like cupin family protein
MGVIHYPDSARAATDRVLGARPTRQDSSGRARIGFGGEMTAVGRYAKMTARPGQGEALARKMLEVADALREVPGCELYLINRSSSDPDVVWVTELWHSQEQLDQALQGPGARDRIGEVLGLVREDGFERVDLEPLGGVGYGVREGGFAVVNLDDVEDMAARFGLGETGEARFARAALGATATGLSLQRLRPGARQSFGHVHRRDEEVYVILSGSGRVAVDDEVREVKRLDAIRVAPGSTRAFEAGPDGLEFLATGTHHAGDAEMLPGFWPG